MITSFIFGVIRSIVTVIAAKTFHLGGNRSHIAHSALIKIMEYHNGQFYYSSLESHYYHPAHLRYAVPYNRQDVTHHPTHPCCHIIVPSQNHSTANSCIPQIVGNSNYHALALDQRLILLQNAVLKIGNEVRSTITVSAISPANHTQSVTSHMQQLPLQSPSNSNIAYDQVPFTNSHPPPTIHTPMKQITHKCSSQSNFHGLQSPVLTGAKPTTVKRQIPLLDQHVPRTGIQPLSPCTIAMSHHTGSIIPTLPSLVAESIPTNIHGVGNGQHEHSDVSCNIPVKFSAITIEPSPQPDHINGYITPPQNEPHKYMRIPGNEYTLSHGRQ